MPRRGDLDRGRPCGYSFKVLEQNGLEVFVNPPLLTLPSKIGGRRIPRAPALRPVPRNP
jgi:hypothetical protein